MANSRRILKESSLITDSLTEIMAQVTFKGTLDEFHNFWQHCTNYMSI